MVWRIAGSSSAITMRALAIARWNLGGWSGGHRVEGVHEVIDGSAYEFRSGTEWQGSLVHTPSPRFFAAKYLQYSRLRWRRTLQCCAAWHRDHSDVAHRPRLTTAPAPRHVNSRRDA